MRPIQFETYSTLTAATGLPIPANAEIAWLQAESANIRYRLDGINPSSTTGLIMRNNEPPIEVQGQLELMRFIQESAGAKLNVQYFG